jgi:hypothetical protein
MLPNQSINNAQLRWARTQPLRGWSAYVGLWDSVMLRISNFWTISGSLAFILTLLPAMALAQSDVKSLSLQYYSALKASGGDSFALIVKGMEDAFGTANAVSMVERRVPMYCQPDSLVLNVENALRILDDEVKRTSRVPNTPLSFILLDGLRRTFPCQK